MSEPTLVPVAELLAAIEKMRDRAKAANHPEPLYRCSRCLDTTWIEVDDTGRGTVRRCHGRESLGCSEIAHRLTEARKKRAQSVTAEAGAQSRGRDEGAM